MSISMKWMVICLALTTLSSCNGQRHDKMHGHNNHSKNNHHIKQTEGSMKIQKPNRVTHTYTQTINGSIKKIMPLYCPVRELDWCENWAPTAVYSNSGVVEKDCIFITPHGNDDIVWIVSDFNLEKGFVKMFYHVPGVLVTKLEIQTSFIAKNKTKAILSYSKTSLSKKGDEALIEFTKESYDIMMDSWEKAMNHYLKTGKMLTGLPNF